MALAFIFGALMMITSLPGASMRHDASWRYGFGEALPRSWPCVVKMAAKMAHCMMAAGAPKFRMFSAGMRFRIFRERLAP